ncbi:MAG: general secretion pathway protein GspB [Caldimonas sp.]|uniref:general secretion pathway protein GspB n=1 Tax=Caldimonas sp. TaxID=2838790 RepID=UPI003919761D
MSYILDALRRADAQRGRGAVPRLDSQHAADPAFENESPRSRAPLWLAVGVLLGLAVPGVAYWMGRGGAPAPMPPTPRPMAEASLPMPSSSPAEASSPTPSSSPAAASLPTPLPAPTAAPSPAPAPTSAPAPVQAPRPAPAQVEAPPPPAPAPVRSPAPSRPAPAAAPPVAAAPAPVPRPSAAPAPAPLASAPRLQDLPDALRSQLPSLSLGGLIYSSTPADRIVIVNGQPYREGDAVGRDLVIEEILPRAAVMRWRDQRYQLTY